MTVGGEQARAGFADDVCSLTLARRLAALLDFDAASIRQGDLLPRGWHVILFNAPTRQSELRDDGAAHLGVTLPDIGLPRLMLGGRQNRFLGDIPIGAKVRRETREGDVQIKEGRSGRFAVVRVEHRIFVDGEAQPAVIEVQDYILRQAATTATPVAQAPVSSTASTHAADLQRTILPDEPMLFRYSAITDNPHRIHYDQPYATERERYPALVVNGSIPALFLMELFRNASGREPATFTSRNIAPMYAGRPLHLGAQKDGAAWRLWAVDDAGSTTFDARVEQELQR